MSIVKEDNGTYTLYYTKTDVVTRNKSRTKKRGFRTQKEAKMFERSLSRESSKVTFYSLFEELQTTIEQERDTYLDKKGVIENYLPFLKTMRYEDISKSYLLNLRNQISNLDISNRTKNKLICVIKSTCKYANDIYDLNNNSKILKTFKEDRHFKYNIWTPDEYNKFEIALYSFHPDYVPFFHLLYYSGLRKGEARALTIDDLDLENKTISVTKSMRKYKSSTKSPKTTSGNRVVKLDNKTIELLRPLKLNEKYLFGDFRPLNRNTIDNIFKKAIELSEVTPIRIHDLRHSHASYLINCNANVVAISKRLGHASVNITLETYAHIIKEAENKIIDVLNDVDV